MYDLGHLAACLERQQSGALGAGTLVRPSCQKLATGVASPTETSLFFLDEGRKVLIAANQNLALWDLTRNKQLWSWKWNRRISSMAAASKDVVILGSNNGIMALVNHQRVQRTNFSLSPTPTILKEWVSYKGLDTPSGERCMGIRRLVVDCVWPHGDGLLHLNWVTFGGWHLSACVELSTVSTKYERPTIHHETAQVQCQNSAGEPVRPPRITWSLPVENKVQVTSTSDALFWEDVPAMTQILPGHDCRVAGMTEQSLYVRATGKPGLLCKFADHAPLSRIPLSKRKGSPTCLAVHPSHEWIVVGTKQDKFYVINSRPKV